MNIVNEELLKKMVDAIVQEVEPEQIYLFGSQARGEAREDSDVDLMVVEREPFSNERSKFQETNRIYKALSRFVIPIDVVLFSTDEMVKWGESRYHIAGRCRREGRLIYDRV